jgi:hypothetical protein
MATLRAIKKDIDYLTEEVLSDSYLAIFFHPEKKEQVLAIMQKAVDLRNNLFQKVNNPPMKSGSLAGKHYTQVRREMLENIDVLFNELSAVSK